MVLMSGGISNQSALFEFYKFSDKLRLLFIPGSILLHPSLDIDECSTQTHNCSLKGICTNVDHSFECECQSGFTGDGNTCVGKFT